MDEVQRLQAEFYKRFGAPARIGARQPIQEFKADLKKALETGDPGHLIPPEYGADGGDGNVIRD